MIRFWILFCLQLVVLIYVVRSDGIYNLIKPVKINCSSNKNRANITCGLKAVNRNEYDINTQIDLHQPLRNFLIRLETFRMYNGYRPFILNYTECICDFMAGRRHSVILDIAKRFFYRYSNINHTCPYTGSLIVRGLRYMPGSLPLLIPQGKYRMRFTGFDDTTVDSHFSTADLYVEVMEVKKRGIKGTP